MNYVKNYENWLNFVKVMPKIQVVPFIPDTVYIEMPRLHRSLTHRSDFVES